MDPICNPQSRRFTYSVAFTKSNHIFGDDQKSKLSTYEIDYTPEALKNVSRLNTPCLAERRQERVAQLNVPNYEESWRRIALPDINQSGRPSSGTQRQTTGQQPPVEKTQAQLLKDRKRQLQATNFKFGNDKVVKVTDYQEFSAPKYVGPRKPPCSPPSPAEIIPRDCHSKHHVTSLCEDDYIYFGPKTSASIYQGRRKDLNDIKSINTFDGVGNSLHCSKTRPLLSTSRVTYTHPLTRMVHGVPCTIKKMMVQNISPSVRMDSLWQSETYISRLTTENRNNFTWPHVGGMQRFYRGNHDVTKVR